jgi:hypothetical protein
VNDDYSKDYLEKKKTLFDKSVGKYKKRVKNL